ncbi:MAG: electron transfer flavoprotein subunit beta/FixA family protein [Deltaproteobacteria bacterium]|nr:electron transfer flavoprotein subunit beta/FixA family protein [Deltaproteobacteria bacterium]
MTLRIVVCAKEVLDPDAVNNYALEGRLVIGDDGKSLTQASIPRLMNAYDEQAIEAALRIREAGVACTVTVVSVGEAQDILKHAASLGIDEPVAIQADPAGLDHHGIAKLLAAFVRSRGGADLVLCGRQASDDDQGLVPALLAEYLGTPAVTIARSVEVTAAGEGFAVGVVRVTPDGDETVAVAAPAVVTISNELGQARYPTMAGRMAARKKKIGLVTPAELGIAAESLRPRVTLAKQFVPTVKSACEMIAGATPDTAAQALIARLRAENVLR